MTSHYTVEADIERDWKIISDTATVVLQSVAADASPEPARWAAGTVPEAPEEALVAAADEEKKMLATELIQHKRERLRRRDFGLSLLLSNQPLQQLVDVGVKEPVKVDMLCNLMTWFGINKQRRRGGARTGKRRS